MPIEDNVLSIAERRPHLMGPARCVDCGYEWTAVAPAGTMGIDCPNCDGFRAARIGLVRPSGTVWTCHCKSRLFYITEEPRAVCVGCGAAARNLIVTVDRG